MGIISLPAQGSIYFDANCFIYTVEQVQPFFNALIPIWQAAQAGSIHIITSELTALEVLVKPFQSGDTLVETAYHQILEQTQEVNMEPISLAILKHAAHLRAYSRLKTPDAIHIATALHVGCVQLYTNDIQIRSLPSLAVV
jgi:uncharacterized protein